MPKILSNIPLVNIIENRIKHDILHEKFTVGEKLVVRVLCERYQVSETPVKQALNRLASEGVVELVQRHGFRVVELSYADYLQTMKARVIIENAAVADAIAAVKKHSIYRLLLEEKYQANAFAIEQYLRTRDDEDYERARYSDWDFHGAIVKATENKYLLKNLNFLIMHQRMYSFVYITALRNRMPLVLEEHTLLFQSLMAGDCDAAINLLDRHLIQTTKAQGEVFPVLPKANPGRKGRGKMKSNAS